MRCDLDVVRTFPWEAGWRYDSNIGDTEPRYGWDATLGTWLEARHDFDGTVMQNLGHG